MTYILHIETSTKVCSVGLSADGVLSQLVETSESGYVHGEKITLFIQEVLDKEGIRANQLNAVSVASGPGSYTGLRIGVSSAKGLCFALGIPLIAIDSLTCLNELGKDKYKDKTIIAMIDARRMEVFSKVFDSISESKIEATIIDEITFEDKIPFIAIGDGVAKLKEFWLRRDIVIDDEIFSSAKGQVRIAAEKYRMNEFEDLAYFEPFYLKDFVAGISKKNPLS